MQQLCPDATASLVSHRGPSSPTDQVEPVENLDNERPFQKLSPAILTEFCNVWFDKYHSWFPILHRPTALEHCRKVHSEPSSKVPLILKSIAAVIIPSYCPSTNITPAQQREWSQALKDEVTLAAIRQLSLQSLQALLMVTIAEYGDGRLSEFWNLIALCKRYYYHEFLISLASTNFVVLRISTQLGLRDLVAHCCVNFGAPLSVIPPRMLPLPATAVEREEKIRAFWATEALDSASTLGVAWNLTVLKPEPMACVPCNDDIWKCPDSAIAIYPFGDTGMTSSFSLFVRLVTNDLWHVHNFLQLSYDSHASIDFEHRQNSCTAVDQLLMEWKNDLDETLALPEPPYSDLFSVSEGHGQHSNAIHVYCTIDSAVISLYQRLILPVSESNPDIQPWTHAADRCLASCDHMADILRNANDSALQIMSPLVIFCIFIAARFYIIYTRALNLTIPSKLHLLIYALNVCSQRWPLAWQLQKVLETAIREDGGSTTENPLPSEFYDLQYFSLDIAKALRQWANRASTETTVYTWYGDE